MSAPARTLLVSATTILTLGVASSTLAATYTVTHLGDSGEGSLRWAMGQANLPGPDDIVFDGLTGTISPATELPTIRDDRTRLLGETGDIRIHASPGIGLRFITADSCVVRGLEIDGNQYGVVFDNCRYAMVGGSDPGFRNHIHDNQYSGVGIVQGSHNTVSNCLVENNQFWGVAIGPSFEPAHNVVGGPGAGNVIVGNVDAGVILFEQIGTTISHNVISGNLGGGVGVLWAGEDIVIEDNMIGFDATGLVPMGNTLAGILFKFPRRTRNNVIRGNVIGANGAAGISIAGSRDTRIEGNIIGSDINGFLPYPNGSGPGTGGIALSGPECFDNVIGPLNTIVGHNGPGQFGVWLRTEATGNVIRGNRIGVNVQETLAVPNHVGILIEAPDNTVDGWNLISGNDSHGIVVRGHPATIVNNWIGTGRGAGAAYGNESGVLLEGGRCTIGGDQSEGNVISGNRAWGIEAHGSGVLFQDLVIAGNRIGIGWSQNPLGNGVGGIWLGEGLVGGLVGAESFGNRDRANAIAYNQGPGVRIGEDGASPQAAEIRILSNGFMANEGKAIDLFSGMPPGNEGVQSPVILTAGTTLARGTVTLPAASTGGRIQLYYNRTGEPEGTFEVGEFDVTETDWSYTFPDGVPEGTYLTATFTDASSEGLRNTSEFAAPVLVRTILQVRLDIVPESCVNPISRHRQGVFPAAIMGREDFDVADIDLATVRVEGVAPRGFTAMDLLGLPDDEPCSCSPVGPDGFDDLVLRVPAGPVLEAWEDRGDASLQVTGMLLDGTPFEGSDCVSLRGGGPYSPTVDATEADLREGIVRLGASRDREQAVTYALDHFSSVRLSVFDVSGRLIRSLKPTGNGPGVHTVTWDSSLLPSGVYLYRFETDRTVETRKLVLFR